MNEVMSRERAANEIKDWLDYKRVKASARESYKSQIEVLEEAMMTGDISLDNTTFEINQKLVFKVDGLIDSLTYKPRMAVGDLNKVPTKPGDFDGKIAAYIAALTGKGLSHIQKLDTEDYKIGQAIAVFFI